MPMIGLVDPSHYERSHDEWSRLPNWYSLEETLERARTGSVKSSNWPYELIAAVLGEFQERAKRISTTTLTSACPRGEVVKRMEDYVGTLDDLYAALRGTMVHRTLESYAREASIAEAWFATTIDGLELSCSPDLLDEYTLFDYKVPISETGVPSFSYPFKHQTQQLMLNAYIVRHAERWKTRVDGKLVDDGPLAFDPRETPVRQVAIVYVGPRMPKIIVYEKTEEFITPSGKAKKAKRPYVWTDDEVLEAMRPRLHVMSNALASYPEWPEPWEDPDSGAVYTAEGLWGGRAGWRCPGPPLCRLPGCTAARWPDALTWEPTREG